MNTNNHTTCGAACQQAVRDRLHAQLRAAEIVQAAGRQLNVSLGRLPSALRQLGNAPAFTGGSVPRELFPVRDLLADLQAAGHALRRAIRIRQALGDDAGICRAATADLDAAQLDAATWAIDVGETFAPAVGFFGGDAEREDLAELAGACAFDLTGWPWSELDRISARVAEAERRLAREIRLSALGWLRGHELDMADLRVAGQGTLAARVEFECRDQLTSLRQAAGIAQLEQLY